ncbi:NADH-quinone oxidoreductase subunit J [Nitrospirillum sp. BR 11163]|uniref:NADH-quinone oxidoreductase subunit J n=1 Tax=Nitrospirillum sp. BR 11163 TaxID=3104323 RepID=UPI002AFEA584|nr:NADH-quinone oxidoreductase subunit J [Nitrospirillum sp. BR 11163]MEA1673923.1 NADH-quinone oxidoreductase subunit J [Nitrospirillum sp. BR 11163]
MILPALAFYLFAAVLVLAGMLVITARNPVHSVLFLILAFFNAAGLFVLIGAEFVAMILVIVYVGAVAVLFLFVVMMLDINFQELRKGFLRYLPAGLAVGAALLAELGLVISGWVYAGSADSVRAAPTPESVGNAQALGDLLYTQYAFIFEASGLVLLVAMIGAIVLTLRSRKGVRRQVIADQLARRREDVVAVVKVQTGEGV